MVVGGLASLADMPSATQWMVETLQSMRGPSVAGTYTKTDSFQGLLFVKFHTVMERDTAVALIRSASLKLGDAHVWATQDLPVPARARKLFMMGLRWQLAQWGFVKREIQLDDDFISMRVGPRKILQLTIEKDMLNCKWSDTWSAWKELHDSPELAQLIARSNNVLQRQQSKGAGKSKSKTSSS